MSYSYELGNHSFPITTSTPDAQVWFDRGLNWCFGFNHEEAERCFRKALEHDPQCSMAHWGIAFAVGPNYNRSWSDFGEEQRRQHLEIARSESRAAARNASSASVLEQDLCQALTARFPDDPDENYDGWNEAYVTAMRPVYAAHRDHPDVCSLFADALMTCTPWNLWDLQSGEPVEGAYTLESIDVIETALSNVTDARRHPGLLHLHIHVMEMSPWPERALKSGDLLYPAVPDSGHLRHMPTHIDVLCGNYQAVVERNHAAVVANRKFVADHGVFNFYTGYRAHDYHFKAYGAMFLGQFGPAIEAVDEMAQTIPEDLLRSGDPPVADWLEAYLSVRQHVLIRFGKWCEILEQPLPQDPELYCVTTTSIRYARGVAYAATGRVEEAEAERKLFETACEQVPETRKLFNNRCVDILEVARAMLNGEIEYRKGAHDLAFRYLRRAVDLDDNLAYDEPWAWMQPARHALGALLLEQRRVDEAELVYREDLGLDPSVRRSRQHPDNVWSLHGLHECLHLQGKIEEAAIIRQRLALASARADVPVESSCFCRQS